MPNMDQNKDVDEFWTGLVDRLGRALSTAKPTIERVGGSGGGNRHRVYPLGQTYDPASEPLHRIVADSPAIGDRVMIAESASGQRYIAGRLMEYNESEARAIPAGTAASGGRYLSLGNMCGLGPLTGITITANRVYYVPIFIPETFTIVAGQFQVTGVPAGGGLCMVGLYDNNPTGMAPMNLIATSTAPSVGSSSVKTQTYVTPAYCVGPRWYWAALLTNGAYTILGSVTAANLPNIRGWASTNMQDVSVMVSQDVGAGWSALPPTASITTVNNTYLHFGLQTQ
jgi:hypothetical protein